MVTSSSSAVWTTRLKSEALESNSERSNPHSATMGMSPNPSSWPEKTNQDTNNSSLISSLRRTSLPLSLLNQILLLQPKSLSRSLMENSYQASQKTSGII